MDECKVIDYSVEWRDPLRNYMRKTFLRFSDLYIDYCIERSSDRVPSKIVVNSNGDIVGCHLYFCTKAMVNGEVIETKWGHDTFLDKEYRSSFGVDFMLAIQKTDSQYKGFGLGLTKVNDKIQKRLKKVYFEGVYTYYSINGKCFSSLFQKLFHVTPKLYQKEVLKVGKHVFKRVFRAEELVIPNGGFWNKGRLDLDFIRDEEFLNQRFFNNKVYDYYLFSYESKNRPCYFVVRKAEYRGFPALMLSDYRYSDPSMASIIMKAVQRLAGLSNYGILFFVCGDRNIEAYFKGKPHYKTHMDFIAHKQFQSDMTFCVTGADSDAEFIK